MPVERWRGSAGEFHARTVPPIEEATLWWFEVATPALVLGSTQPESVVDHPAAQASGVEVVRRRSGGGAVLLAPGTATWVDVLLPRTDPRWTDDVGRSFDWLGRAWVDALAELGVAGAVVRTGPLLATTWSALVCFAGLGPGEVTVGGRKVVGIAQRRTRDHARFQCAVLHRWDAAGIAALVDPGAASRSELAADLEPLAVGLEQLVDAEVPAPAVVAALARAIAADG